MNFLKVLFVWISFLSFALAADAASLSPREFTDAAAAAAKAAIPSAEVTVVGNLQLETRNADGKTISTDLRNAYDVYLRDPKNLDEIIHRYIGVLAETVRLGDEAAILDRSRIVPVLKPRKWVDGMQKISKAQNNAGSTSQVLIEPFNAELSIVYAEDRPQSVRFLTARDDVGDRAKLRDLAIANLGRLIPKIEMEAAPNGNYLIHAGGTYEASLLLVEPLWSNGQIKVDGDIVVAIPARDVLMVTGSQNEASIARLHALANKLATGPYALTSTLFVHRSGKFVALDSR